MRFVTPSKSLLAAQCVLANDYLERVREHIKYIQRHDIEWRTDGDLNWDALNLISDLQTEIHREYCEELRIESDI